MFKLTIECEVAFHQSSSDVSELLPLVQDNDSRYGLVTHCTHPLQGIKNSLDLFAGHAIGLQFREEKDMRHAFALTKYAISPS